MNQSKKVLIETTSILNIANALSEIPALALIPDLYT